jgi:hypothetical protein
MGLGEKVERGGGAPGLDADVVALGEAGGDAVVGEIGNGFEQLADAEVRGECGGF